MLRTPTLAGVTRRKEMDKMTECSYDVLPNPRTVGQEKRHLSVARFNSFDLLRRHCQSHNPTAGAYRLDFRCTAK